MTDKLVPVDVPSAISFGFDKWYRSFEFPVDTKQYLNWENSFQTTRRAQFHGLTRGYLLRTYPHGLDIEGGGVNGEKKGFAKKQMSW